MIRASELRAVITEHDRYKAAVFAFRDKYLALPGDITNATAFWGDQATGTSACASAATADGTPGTCNGNGDGYIGGPASSGPEGVRAWQHLQMAGLIEGTLTGHYDGSKLTIRVNVPSSPLDQTGWALLHRGAGLNQPIWGQATNFLALGSELNNELWGPALIAVDAWNIDKKIDDGEPATGSMLSGRGNGLSCTVPNSAFWAELPANHTYALTATVAGCISFFKL